jgi:hypothetical protein
MRQAPVLDLASDEKAESFLVDSGLMGNSEPQSARFTGVSTPADVNP